MGYIKTSDKISNVWVFVYIEARRFICSDRFEVKVGMCHG